MKERRYFNNIFILFSLLFCFNIESKKYNIGLLVMATGKYISFVKPLIESAEKYFCTKHNVTYFIFTDSENFFHEKSIIIPQSRLGWPYDTLMRFEVYYKNKDKYQNMDYIYATDADMLFLEEVGDEILSERVGTHHPGFYKRKIELPYERNPISTAYIKKEDDKFYFAGGFYGGTKDEVIKLFETTSKNIQEDLQNYGFVAKHHDESHINKYFNSNPPTKSLSPSYCFPEDVDCLAHDDYKNIVSLQKKLIALAKKDANSLHEFN